MSVCTWGGSFRSRSCAISCAVDHPTYRSHLKLGLGRHYAEIYVYVCIYKYIHAPYTPFLSQQSLLLYILRPAGVADGKHIHLGNYTTKYPGRSMNWRDKFFLCQSEAPLLGGSILHLTFIAFHKASVFVIFFFLQQTTLVGIKLLPLICR